MAKTHLQKEGDCSLTECGYDINYSSNPEKWSVPSSRVVTKGATCSYCAKHAAQSAPQSKEDFWSCLTDSERDHYMDAAENVSDWNDDPFADTAVDLAFDGRRADEVFA